MLAVDISGIAVSEGVGTIKDWALTQAKRADWKKQVVERGTTILERFKNNGDNFDYTVLEKFLKTQALENSLMILRYPPESAEYTEAQGVRDLLLHNANILPNQKQMVQQIFFGAIDEKVKTLLYDEGNSFEQWSHQELNKGICALKNSQESIIKYFQATDNSKTTTDLVEHSRNTLAIVSFSNGTDHIDHASNNTFNLCEMFEGRTIRPSCNWADVAQQTVDSLQRRCKSKEKYVLMLETHSSIAFVAGSILTSVAGFDVHIMQKDHQGCMREWYVDTTDATQYDLWNIKKSKQNRAGMDLAVAISGSTHNISGVVQQYCKDTSLPIAQFVYFDREGKLSIENGNHCKQLALQISKIVKRQVEKLKANAKIHLFVSGPNTLAFYLGQDQRLLGRIQLYEFSNRTYIPSVLME